MTYKNNAVFTNFTLCLDVILSLHILILGDIWGEGKGEEPVLDTNGYLEMSVEG